MRVRQPRAMKRQEPYEFLAALDTGLKYFPDLMQHAHEARKIAIQFYTAYGVSPHAAFVTTNCPRGGDPFIAMYSAGFIGNIRDIDDTIYLAHELGHHESWLRGDTTEAFEDLMTHRPATVYDTPGTISVSMRKQVLAEEKRAWRYGRKILKSILPKFPHFDTFDSKCAENLEGYRKGLLL